MHRKYRVVGYFMRAYLIYIVVFEYLVHLPFHNIRTLYLLLFWIGLFWFYIMRVCAVCHVPSLLVPCLLSLAHMRCDRFIHLASRMCVGAIVRLQFRWFFADRTLFLKAEFQINTLWLVEYGCSAKCNILKGGLSRPSMQMKDKWIIFINIDLCVSFSSFLLMLLLLPVLYSSHFFFSQWIHRSRLLVFHLSVAKPFQSDHFATLSVLKCGKWIKTTEREKKKWRLPFPPTISYCVSAPFDLHSHFNLISIYVCVCFGLPDFSFSLVHLFCSQTQFVFLRESNAWVRARTHIHAHDNKFLHVYMLLSKWSQMRTKTRNK